MIVTTETTTRKTNGHTSNGAIAHAPIIGGDESDEVANPLLEANAVVHARNKVLATIKRTREAITKKLEQLNQAERTLLAKPVPVEAIPFIKPFDNRVIAKPVKGKTKAKASAKAKPAAKAAAAKHPGRKAGTSPRIQTMLSWLASHPASTVQQIINALASKGDVVSVGTMQTTIARLKKSGIVGQTREGRNAFYSVA